jgi:hypothetical protein
MTPVSVSGLKWRRAIAAACALSLFSTSVGWFTGSDEGVGAALVFGSPALVIGAVAAWWAWRGYAVRPTPPLVVAVLGALFGGALTFLVAFLITMALTTGQDRGLAGLPAVFAAPLGAVVGGVVGWRRQRRVVREGRAAPFS